MLVRYKPSAHLPTSSIFPYSNHPNPTLKPDKYFTKEKNAQEMAKLTKRYNSTEGSDSTKNISTSTPECSYKRIASCLIISRLAQLIYLLLRNLLRGLVNRWFLVFWIFLCWIRELIWFIWTQRIILLSQIRKRFC